MLHRYHIPVCFRDPLYTAGWIIAIIAVVLAALVLISGCASTTAALPPVPSRAPVSSQAATSPSATSPASPASGVLKAIRDPGQVTGTLTGPCHMTGTYPDQLPDPHCTPGSIDPVVNQANIHQTVCVKGWEAAVGLRPPEAQTQDFKYNHAYPAYGVPDGTKTELDHFIPLELGGSNDATNLWPEPETSIPNKKDGIEDAAREAVCDGQMTLAVAQKAIAENWVSLGQQLRVGQ